MSRFARASALAALSCGAAALLAAPGAPAVQDDSAPSFGVTLAGQTGSVPGKGQTKSGDVSPAGTFELKGSVAGLFPGRSTTIPLKIENYSSTRIRVTELTATVRAVTGRCAATQLLLGSARTARAGTQSGLSLVIAAHGESVHPFPLAMDPLPGRIDDSCQSATWTLDYSGKAVKA